MRRLLILLAFAACAMGGDGEGCETGDGEPCASNADCPAGETCKSTKAPGTTGAVSVCVPP